MSAMNRSALPSRSWTLVYTAGSTNIAINVHGHPEVLMNVGQGSAPSGDLRVDAYVPFRLKREPFTVDSGDKIYLYNNSDSPVDVTVWA